MSNYRGRFAPSPTGPLHFGSLIAAVGSYLEARTRGGAWLVRMEDLDRAREQPGAADSILATLQACGFEWDGAVTYQSRRSGLYEAALEQLRQAGHTFACACSRKEIADSTVPIADDRALVDGHESPLPPRGGGVGGEGAGNHELVYPGTCRNGLPPGKTARAMRVRVGDAVIDFEDSIQGRLRQDLAHESGDFVLHRADGFFAYQLAVVVDDAEQGITDVVRGADLLDSTPRQIFLQRLLGLATPRYAHLPVATNAAGEKLSKQTLAAAVADADVVPNLVQALAFLGQQPPATLASGGIGDVWAWALHNWDLASVPRKRASLAE